MTTLLRTMKLILEVDTGSSRLGEKFGELHHG
jgi:hypothetical protein